MYAKYAQKDLEDVCRRMETKTKKHEQGNDEE